MKTKRAILSLLLLMILAMPTAALADGFAIYEWSAAGAAMGEAYMFAEDDPSVLAYSPAGITRLNGKWISGGASYINPRGRVDFNGNWHSGETWSNTEAPGYVPNLFYVQQQSDRLWWGIGLFSRFGNSTKYEPTFPGRYNSDLAKITGLTLQPTIAYKLTPKLSVAAGLDINYIRLELGKKIPGAKLDPRLAGTDVDFQLDGNNTALGWNIGLNYDFTDKTSFAALYHSRITQNMDADAVLSIPALNTGAHGSVTLPDSLTLGLGHKFDDRTRVEVGAVYTKWSTYDELAIVFDKNLPPTPPDIKNWKNVWRYHMGIEHKINDHWSILGGYAYDNSPMPDENMDFQVPTGDRQTASIGFKYRNKNSELSFGYGYMWIKDRVVPGSKYSPYTGDYADVYNSDAHILGIGYTIHLK